MTLVRTALRLATVNALQGTTANAGPTIARNRVYDSRISDFSPETFPADAKPSTIVQTDEDEGEALSDQNGGPPFRRNVMLVIEFAMVQGFDVEVENGGTAFVPGYPATDAEHEASLDLLEFQIIRRLAYDLDPACALWRGLARAWKYDCHRQVVDDSGVKIAARVLTLECEVTDDQITVVNTATDDIPAGLDILPEPLRSVAYSLPAGSTGRKACEAIAAALIPLQVGPLDGIDFRVDAGGEEEPSAMFDVTMEIRSALEVAQTVATGPSVVIDYARGTYQQLILAANVSAVSIINWPAVGKTGRLILQVTNTGNFGIDPSAWPAGTGWVAGQRPVITLGAGKKDLLVFTTASKGAEILANIVGQNYS